MNLKRITIVLIYLTLLFAYAAKAETQRVNDNKHPLNGSGFTFSPIAHAHTAELLSFIATFGQLNRDEQKSTYTNIVQKLAEDQSNTKSRIKQAAILAIPNSSLRDTHLAQQKLDALLADSSMSNSNMDLIKLIHSFTLEHNEVKKEASEITKKADRLKLRNRALSRKLNDIKNIEKSMIERNAKTNH